jgi:cystathionine beta-lyase/cystathionine gamma-synthase
MKQQTLLVRPHAPCPHTGEIVTAIHPSVIYALDELSSTKGNQYGRIANDTRTALESVLMRLHNASWGIATASGSSAIFMVSLLLRAGDTLLHHHELYEGTGRIFHDVLTPFRVTAIRTDFTDERSLEHQVEELKPKMLWAETPTNPSLRVLPIARLASIAHRHGAMLVVDTTMCSGGIQQPLTHGADIVVESLTKLLNGHSDVIGGFIGTNNDAIGKRLRFLTQTTGPVLDPQQCFLVLRGMKTLTTRIRAQQQTATVVSKWLRHHPAISHVMVPGSAGREEQQIVREQMRGKGTLVSFLLANDRDPSAFAKKLKLICISHSFGGVETVIQHPARMMNWEKTPTFSLPNEHLFRLSLGLEHPDDIIADLKQALEQ